MELKRDDIIKALECCANKAEGCLCSDCPFVRSRYCTNRLRENALLLIKELTEENERLNQTITQLGKNNDEIARVYPLAIKEAEANTVRKMQGILENRINNKLSYHGWFIKETVIAGVVKEMLEAPK